MKNKTHENLISRITHRITQNFLPRQKGDMRYKIRDTRAFTLVELLVSIAIFTIIMIFAMGGIIAILDAYKKTQSIQSAMTNLNFALETMTRDIRFGTDYSCASPCNDISVVFREDNENIPIEFSLDEGAIIRKVDGVNQDLTANVDNVSIENMDFYTQGIGVGNGQPKVTIVITGRAGFGETASEFTLQTTVSQRILDQS